MYLNLYGHPGKIKKRLGYHDCISLTVMRNHLKEARIISVDEGFDNVAAVTRIWTPEDVAAKLLPP